MTHTPDFILCAQHGWADTHRDMATLARALASADTLCITPELGWLKTWLRIEPLIQHVEQQIAAALAAHPAARLRIIGHSMGGLIWLELLHRRRDWWPQVDSLVLLACPVGGADLARIVDPFQLGIGIARDLGADRRPIAEAIAQQIATLSIAGDSDGGSDGTITVGSTQFSFAQTLVLPGVSHTAMRSHASVTRAIQQFWSGEPARDRAATVIALLRAVPGMTDAHQRDFRRAVVSCTLDDSSTIRLWKNPLQVQHVFLADPQGRCLFGGYVGWAHAPGLLVVLDTIRQQFSQASP